MSRKGELRELRELRLTHYRSRCREEALRYQPASNWEQAGVRNRPGALFQPPKAAHFMKLPQQPLLDIPVLRHCLTPAPQGLTRRPAGRPDARRASAHARPG